MKRNFPCEACSRVFEHPEVDWCETIDGYCEHLMNAGWRPAHVRVYRHREGDHMPESALAFSRGGWLCPQHATPASKVGELIDRSSLGTPAAKAIREQSPPDAVRRVLERADEDRPEHATPSRRR